MAEGCRGWRKGGSGRGVQRAAEGCRGLQRAAEGCGGLRRAVEGGEGLRRAEATYPIEVSVMTDQ